MNAVSKQEVAAVALPLTLPERAAVALGTAAHEIKLHELVKSSADIVAVIDAPGRDQAHRIGMNLKGARVAIEKVGKNAREDATAFSKAIIAEEKRLIAIAEPEELRILTLRDGFDEAEQARKDALIAAERLRLDLIQGCLQNLRDYPLQAVGKSSQEIGNLIGILVGCVTSASFDEFFEQAQAARLESLDKLTAMQTAQRNIEIEAESQRQEAARIAAEAEDARIAEDARVTAMLAKIDAERAELAEQQRVSKAEADRVAAAQAVEAKRLAELAAQTAANLQAERDALAEQMRIIAADRAAFVRDTAEAEARKRADIKLEEDHGEAIVDNFKFDIAAINEMQRAHDDSLMQDDAAADLARCTETAKAMLTQGRSIVGASLAAYADAGLDADDEPTIDIEAIAWAYRKLLAFGVGSDMHSAMMMDRLNSMLTAEVAA